MKVVGHLRVVILRLPIQHSTTELYGLFKFLCSKSLSSVFQVGLGIVHGAFKRPAWLRYLRLKRVGSKGGQSRLVEADQGFFEILGLRDLLGGHSSSILTNHFHEPYKILVFQHSHSANKMFLV